MEERSIIQEVLDSFREIKRGSYQLLSSQADQQGITAIQYMTLRAIIKHPNIGITELAERMKLGNSTVSGIIDRLVKAGMVERTRSETDRRSVILCVTEKGREAEFQIEMKYTEAVSGILDIGEDDLRQMLSTHRRIIEIFDKMREGAIDEQ
ncbi:MarR family winged helix-turn-helix transcriptional regulator [Paenibacillus aceti]|uniref:MarR family transcriptional regulator n=1 Tax=Paenibacillus aceti TaxID=1820010 RepID=A0ABQ1VZJ9_9BACL|nr:MarR family transcriptional regulator [Paenibacillus aceti]GGG07129.1 MarR family transcriptional regulator [Paenibacillus aceti]